MYVVSGSLSRESLSLEDDWMENMDFFFVMNAKIAYPFRLPMIRVIHPYPFFSVKYSGITVFSIIGTLTTRYCMCLYLFASFRILDAFSFSMKIVGSIYRMAGTARR